MRRLHEHASAAAVGLLVLAALALALAAPSAYAGGGTGTIEGTIEIEGTAAAGAEVCLEQEVRTDEFEVVSCHLSNSAGRYAISDVTAGTYHLYFPGFVCTDSDTHCAKPALAQWYDDKSQVAEAEALDIEGGRTYEYDADLLRGAQITGTVTDESSAPLTGLLVCAFNTAERNDHECATTGPGGLFDIEGLAPGPYEVQFVGYYCEPGEAEPCPEVYFPQYYDEKTEATEAETLELSGTEIRSGVDARMRLGGSISGTVTSDSIAPQPVADLEVCALHESSIEGCATTDAAGHYKIKGLPEGEYTVSFLSECPPQCGESSYAEQFYDGSLPGTELQGGATPVAVTPPHEVSGIDAVLVESPVVAPATRSAPVLSGTAAVGDSLHCSQGTWSHNPTAIQYAWLRGATPIAGQAASSYTVQSADQGQSLTCRVTVSNRAGSASAGSNAVAVPAAPVEVTGATNASVHGVAVVKASATVKGAVAAVKLTCTGAGPCQGTVELVATSGAAKASVARHKRGHKRKRKRKIVIGKATFSIAAGSSETVSVKLTAAGKRLLHKAGRKGLKATAKGSGLTAHTVVLKAARRRHKHHKS